MKLVYVGPHDGVEVEMPDGSLVPVLNGAVADFPEEVAKSLLTQRTWSAAPESAPKNTKKAAKAEEDKL